MLAAGSPAGATPSIRKPDLSDLGRDGPTVGLVAIALGSNSGTIACAIASYILKTRVDSRGSDIGGFLETEPGQRRDADPKRMRAFREGIERARTHYISIELMARIGSILMILATHPDYQRQGAGGNLTMYGIDRAKEERLAATLFASPMGRQIYGKMGFRDLGVVKIQVDGESESVWEAVMAYVPTCNEP